MIFFVIFLQDFCDDLRNLSNDKIDDLKIKRNAVTGEPEVYCFPQLIKDFMAVSMGVASNDALTHVRPKNFRNSSFFTIA